MWSGRAPSGPPLVSEPRRCATICRVSDTWPSPGPQKREPLLEHVRDVWTLRYVETNCTASIWRNDFGLELRVENNGEFALEITMSPKTCRFKRPETNRVALWISRIHSQGPPAEATRAL